MSKVLLLVICFQITLVNCAPLLLISVPWMAQSAQQMTLQNQLTQLQALQQLSAQASVQMNTQQQPLMVIWPNQELIPNDNMNEHLKVHEENDHKSAIHTNYETDDDLNSIVIDAASEAAENENQAMTNQPQRAILLIPNARLSIGGIVSAIPWLPIEINVPDTITWAYNGIASGIGSIISIIGRPFQGTTQGAIQDEGLHSVLKQIQSKQHIFRPIVMMPVDGPVLPIRV